VERWQGDNISDPEAVEALKSVEAEVLEVEKEAEDEGMDAAAFEIPADVTCVVIRGHDRTHEYGGQAYLADVETGAARSTRQGSEPETFDPDDCP